MSSLNEATEEERSAFPTIIERHSVLASLRAASERARLGQGSLVVLVGDAGIGKTHTVERLAAIAARDGFQVLWGSCLTAEGAPPFWPWIEALRELAHVKGYRESIFADTPAQPTIGEFIAALTGPEQIREPASGIHPDVARYQLFETVNTLLHDGARDQPILLVLDDLHGADLASVHLLAFVARRLARMRVLIVGTSRTRESTQPRLLFDLLGQSEVQTIPLGGLAPRDVRHILASIIGTEPSRALLRSVVDLTEGNPFFVTEIARWLENAHNEVSDERHAACLIIPESVHAVISRRLNRLSEPTREFLRIAAIFGREVDGELVRSMWHAAPECDLLDALDEAVQEHVLEERSGQAHYRFRHELFRQVLYAELPPGKKARRHASAVATLIARYGAAADAHASELAFHAEKARDLLEPATLMHYSRLAGENALAAHAYDEAIPHLEWALALRHHLPEDAETAALQYGLGCAKAATSRRWNRQEAWEHLTKACDGFVAAGDIGRAVAAATSPAIAPEAVTGVLEVIDRVRSIVPPDSHAAGLLEARAAAAHYFERRDSKAARDGFARALAIAQRSGDMALELRTLALETAAFHFDLQWSAVLEKSRRAIRLAQKIDDLHAETYARYRLAYALAFTGRAEEALVEAHQNLVAAETLADDGLLEDALYINAALAQLRGNWRDARQFSERGLDLAPHHLPLLHLRVLLEFEVGEPEAGGRFLDRLFKASRFAGPYSLREAFCAVVIPQLALLGEESAFPVASPTSPESNPNAVAFMMVGRALTAVCQRNAPDAVDALRSLRSKKGAILAPLLVTERLLGRLSYTTGSFDQAVVYYEEALHFCRYAGYRPELAWSCLDFAQTLVARDRKDDHGYAASLLAESEAIARDLGMRPLLARIAACRQHHQEKLGQDEAPLSRRERRVAQLLVQGKTNQEIADELFISTHTVAAHVARILAKTGCKNRTEAAAYIERELRIATATEK